MKLQAYRASHTKTLFSEDKCESLVPGRSLVISLTDHNTICSTSVRFHLSLIQQKKKTKKTHSTDSTHLHFRVMTGEDRGDLKLQQETASWVCEMFQCVEGSTTTGHVIPLKWLVHVILSKRLFHATSLGPLGTPIFGHLCSIRRLKSAATPPTEVMGEGRWRCCKNMRIFGATPLCSNRSLHAQERATRHLRYNSLLLFSHSIPFSLLEQSPMFSVVLTFTSTLDLLVSRPI